MSFQRAAWYECPFVVRNALRYWERRGSSSSSHTRWMKIFYMVWVQETNVLYCTHGNLIRASWKYLKCRMLHLRADISWAEVSPIHWITMWRNFLHDIRLEFRSRVMSINLHTKNCLKQQNCLNFHYNTCCIAHNSYFHDPSDCWDSLWLQRCTAVVAVRKACLLVSFLAWAINCRRMTYGRVRIYSCTKLLARDWNIYSTWSLFWVISCVNVTAAN